MAHTPGPWEAHPNIGRVLLNGSNAYDVREIFNEPGGWNPEDIRLMAAAPELLVALKVAERVMQDAIQYLDCPEEIAMARAAIAKAEGRSE